MERKRREGEEKNGEINSEDGDEDDSIFHVLRGDIVLLVGGNRVGNDLDVDLDIDVDVVDEADKKVVDVDLDVGDVEGKSDGQDDFLSILLAP